LEAFTPTLTRLIGYPDQSMEFWPSKRPPR
jgi:hypothetical protein